jgi:hypothetical protein
LEGYKSLQNAGFCTDLTRGFLRFLVNFENFLVEKDSFWMQRALELARRGIAVTSPTPLRLSIRCWGKLSQRSQGDFSLLYNGPLPSYIGGTRTAVSSAHLRIIEGEWSTRK